MHRSMSVHDLVHENRYTVLIFLLLPIVKGRRQPTHVRLQGASCGLFRDSTVLLEQLRTLDKSRLEEYMGSVGEDKMREVDAALNVSVGLAEIYHRNTDHT